MKAAAIILAGGKSSRMGTNKALLKINEKTNIERIADALKLLFDDIILVTNDSEQYEFLGLRMVADHFPGMGPLAGVHAGLLASDYDVNFIVACDMPFVSTELAEALVHNCGHYDAVIPVINGKQHPLFAVFQKKTVEEVAASIEAGRLRMKHLLDQLNVLYVTETELQTYSHLDIERVFFNMNHPNEYEEAKKWAEAD
ncbi:molybdenum cofactor guanylyltransferase [Neobacillus sp. OS1-2]|uniref:molybdenum cofactor guanylyltransferase n=1 Tax=Neobacillus sp. OS1-2 TaxID=3070680 RepID=UPI0027E01D98|nr:molybdenum cofactor guanylyltransferase [Neobacillus sp. OS1-2]WML41706.1 molybdenum cofactor guanylyltransferase [Neobacillus sp. OS1-2]